MKSVFLFFALIFGFCSCAIFKCNEEYYPCTYQNYYDLPFRYLHNCSNNLQLELISSTDTVKSGSPLKLTVLLFNKSESDTIYYGYFNKNYDFELKKSDGGIYRAIVSKFAITGLGLISTDHMGRLFTPIFQSNRILFPTDSIILFKEDFYCSEYIKNRDLTGEHYLSCKLDHVEFDSLYNPVETVIKSNEIRFVIL